MQALIYAVDIIDSKELTRMEKILHVLFHIVL